MEGMSHTMKAVSQEKLGGPEVLELVTLPTPRSLSSPVRRFVFGFSESPRLSWAC
jgi:hypothetical protein